MEANEIISSILHACKAAFKSNDNGTSFYLSQRRKEGKPVQIRISNHGTYLRSWVDRTHLKNSTERLLDPSYCINISIVFVDEGKDITKDCPNQKDCRGCQIQPCVPQIFNGQNELGRPFTVYQYMYQSKYIRRRYINGIVKAIRESIPKGEYIDPLAKLYRAAGNKELQSNYNPSSAATKPTISESRLKALISESIKHVLNENARDKRVLDFLKSKGYEDYNERMQIIGCLKHDIPNLRLDGNKFLLGTCRMYLDGQLRDEQSIRNLDNALKFIHAGNHTEEFDENLNGKSVSELHEMFREASRQMSANDRQRSASRQFNGGSQYRIVPINSYEEAKPYGKYTSWCVTHGKNAFKTYTQGGNRFYFCLKDGFENAPKDDDGAPLNEWGLSMIAVNIDVNGDLTRTTTRYNHDFNGENNPELETTEQLEKVLNVPFYQTFKPYTREELHARGIILFDEVQELLDAGTPPEKIFQYVGRFSKGFARVKLNGKSNFIDKNGKLLYGTWFDSVGVFSEGFAWVKLNGKSNFIDKNGKLLFNTWFDDAWNFSEGCGEVRLNGKWNFIDKNCKFLSDTWFDNVGNFSEGFAVVGLNDKWNYINKNGKLLSDTWFDYVWNFSEGVVRVGLNGKYNFIDKNGKLLFNTWFDCASNFFSEGFARVGLNGKRYYIDKNGKLYNERPTVNESRKPIRLSESQLRQMVSKAVRETLRERL